MYIRKFEWDDANIDHIAEHGVNSKEAEAVFNEESLIRRSRDGRYIALGQSMEGRHLMVVFERKPNHVIRVVTARPMTKSELRQYRRRFK